jgi:hypothetical protein
MVGEELCNAVGIPAEQTVGMTLHMTADEIVTLTVTIQPSTQQVNAVEAIIRRYQLIEIDEEKKADG